jgi:NAD(P)-dependent dehydrogenase (short-subunit alcohol dehydrogenase family)
MKRLDNKVAIVTGASKGIGAGIAKAMGAEGAAVVVNYARDREGAEGNFNEIFIELDPVRRAALLAESFTEDCLWIHPGGRVVGRDGINEAASEIRRHFPEYRYTVTNEIQTMHNVATCRWGSGMPDQPFHYTGTDFLEERDACVSRLYTFIDQQLLLS